MPGAPRNGNEGLNLLPTLNMNYNTSRRVNLSEFFFKFNAYSRRHIWQDGGVRDDLRGPYRAR
jgi:hypothetical protein